MPNSKRDPGNTPPSPWTWVTGIVVVAVVGLILTLGPRLFMTPREQAPVAQREVPMPAQAKLYDPRHPVAQVNYRGATFQPAPGMQAVKLPPKQAVLIGKTDEGYMMYALNTGKTPIARNYPGAPSPAGGGGGVAPGQGAPKAVPQAASPVYLRTVDGLFVPLSEVSPARGAGQGGVGGGPGKVQPGGSSGVGG